ncbi:hypothetical protein [Teredinibacter purpureus]|uniref:hypothetical protein n=1 Tax=Teredinibacter purpureus TaxID=2731756 RepID=UPI0005F82556|nr:hypothetical protein [Teredinibacter purpureus]
MKEKYLVYHDYGKGSVWFYLYSGSIEDIEKIYPELKLAKEEPIWFTDEIRKNLEEKLTCDIDDSSHEMLQALLKDRVING